MTKYRPIVGFVLAIGIMIVGCDSVTQQGSDQALQPALSSASLEQLSKTDDEYKALVKPGFFTVCKEAVDDPTMPFEIITTAVSSAGGGDPTSTPISPVELKDGECTDVFEADGPSLPPDIVTITETVPEGWVNPPSLKIWTVDEDLNNGLPFLDPHDPAASVTGTIDRGKIGCLVVFVNDKVEDFRGCTPGFWKNNWDKKDGVAWPEGIDGEFTTLASLGFDGFEVCDGDDTTMFDALSCGGNSQGQEALMRHAAAAYLNASHPLGPYNLSPAGVVAAVNAALASGDHSVIESQKDELDDWNNQGCFVDQHGNLKDDSNDD